MNKKIRGMEDPTSAPDKGPPVSPAPMKQSNSCDYSGGSTFKPGKGKPAQSGGC